MRFSPLAASLFLWQALASQAASIGQLDARLSATSPSISFSDRSTVRSTRSSISAADNSQLQARHDDAAPAFLSAEDQAELAELVLPAFVPNPALLQMDERAVGLDSRLASHNAMMERAGSSSGGYHNIKSTNLAPAQPDGDTAEKGDSTADDGPADSGKSH